MEIIRNSIITEAEEFTQRFPSFIGESVLFPTGFFRTAFCKLYPELRIIGGTLIMQNLKLYSVTLHPQFKLVAPRNLHVNKPTFPSPPSSVFDERSWFNISLTVGP